MQVKYQLMIQRIIERSMIAFLLNPAYNDYVNVDMNCVTEHVPSIHWLSFLVLLLGLLASPICHAVNQEMLSSIRFHDVSAI